MEAKRRFTELSNIVQKEPVTIRSDKGDSIVVLSPLEYGRLTGTSLAEGTALEMRINQTAQQVRAEE